MRNLASVVTIEKCWNLEGKDRVQGCSFVENSYEAMVGKDLKEGDLVVFIQEGSILPLEEKKSLTLSLKLIKKFFSISNFLLLNNSKLE